MLKEINEQPRAIRDTTLGRVSLDTGQRLPRTSMQSPDEIPRNASQITIAACGTSWHAGLAGKFMIERLARLPVEVDYASEYRYRDPIADPRAIGLLITQSGETADTLAAQAELIAKGSKTLAICNVVGAAVTRKAQGTITTNAGPEIGVASTKAFTAQLTALFVFALHLAQVRGTITDEESLHLVTELSKTPRQARLHAQHLVPDATGSKASPPPQILRNPVDAPSSRRRARISPHRTAAPTAAAPPAPPSTPSAKSSPASSHTSDDFLFLGRGIHYPIALEGALKLKEISYIHAEGYPAGEMKHGPNALIDESPSPSSASPPRTPTTPPASSSTKKPSATSKRSPPAPAASSPSPSKATPTSQQLVSHTILIPPAHRTPPPHPGGRPPPTPRLPHSRPPRLRRRPTQKPGEERHGRVINSFRWLKTNRSEYTALDFKSWQSQDALNITPKFQRRGVWTTPAKSYLIDTLILGMPVPPLFLRVVQNEQRTKVIREVVDGQQRISAVLDFIDGKYALSKNLDSPHAGKLFSKLPPDARDAITGFYFICENLQGISDSEVLEIFSRLNQNSVPLNDQELRNGTFFGYFKQAAYRLAYEHVSVWKSMNLFSDQKVARMLEVEFTSELLIAELDGIQDKKKSISEFYEKYDNDFPQRGRAEERFRRVMDAIENAIGSQVISTTPFKRNSNISFAILRNLPSFIWTSRL